MTNSPTTWHGSAALRGLLRPVSGLRLDPTNARRHPTRSIKALVESLGRFGQRKPIVVRADGIVVAGNGTLEAARDLGWVELAVTEVDGLSEADVRAFALADNRTAELSEWDEDALALLMADLPTNVLPSLGWSTEELRDLLPPIDATVIARPVTRLDEKKGRILHICPRCQHEF